MFNSGKKLNDYYEIVYFGKNYRKAFRLLIVWCWGLPNQLILKC